MIRAAIVGLGRWGRNLVEASIGHARLAIVRAVEPDAGRARDFSLRHGLEPTDNLDAVLADPGIDAVLLATPLYWRVHVFGTQGSAEVLDEVTLILRKSGVTPRQMNYPRVDALRAELDAFVDAIEHRIPFPVPEAEVLATLAAFEAALRSMQSGAPDRVR